MAPGLWYRMPFKPGHTSMVLHPHLRDEETKVQKGPHRQPEAELGSDPVVCLLAVFVLVNLLPMRTLQEQGPMTLVGPESFY